MSGRPPWTNSIPTSAVTYSGLQIQTTSTCLPIPIAYGQSMFTPNVIWYNNFQKHPQNGKGAFGKGGGGAGLLKSEKTYTYSASIILALCEGPISGIGMILQGSPPAFPLSDINCTLADGTNPQPVWSYLTSNYPAQALAYNGVAYLYSQEFDLGAGAAVSSYNFEVIGVLAGTGFNAIDADPAQVIYDFLTNTQYGVGFPASSIDAGYLFGGSGTSSYQAYCWANGLAFSPYLNSAEQATSILNRWLQMTNSTSVWSSGLLRIVPYGDQAVTGNGQSWNPNATPLYDLTDSDFVFSDGNDPIKVTRTDPYTTPNWQSIEVLSREDFYNSGPVSIFDQSAIDRFGRRNGSSITAHEICETSVAQASLQLSFNRALYIRSTYAFSLSWEFCILDPMDLVTVTDTVLGLNKFVVRILTVEEQDDGTFAITAEEFTPGVATSVAYPVQAQTSGYPDSSVAAVAVNTPLVFEPPAQLTNNAVQIWAAASGASASPNWGGCYIYASFDGVSYQQVAKITQAAAQGVTTASLASYSGANPDNTDTLSVSLVESGGTLSSTTAANAAGGANLCYVGGEYISFMTATLTGANTYNLTGLYRGLYGVASRTVAAGSPFVLLTVGLAEYTLPTANIGDTLSLKFQSFNIFGKGLQDLTTCTVYTYSITGFGIAPAAAYVSGGNNQSATHSTTFGAGLAVLVKDATGAPLPGITVSFTSPGSGASCTWSGSNIVTAVTNASGIATSPAPTANATTGSYAVNANAGGTSVAVQFNLTNT